jgi:hypothetical protein
VGGPGLDFETWVFSRKWVDLKGGEIHLQRNPGLKSETWATHSMFVRASFMFLGGLQVHEHPDRSEAKWMGLLFSSSAV